ncbi:hypothetical protein B4087_1846 [Bacillus cereus]|nr:hypothetical protein B4087_1846 [Bacillus cereus]
MRIGTNVLSINARHSLYENVHDQYYRLFPLRLERLNNTSNNPEHVAIVTRFYTKASEMRATIYIVSQAN